MMTAFLGILVLLFLMGTGECFTRSDYVAQISPQANTNWGTWGEIDWCLDGYYAYGFGLRVEGWQGNGFKGSNDDTAVNAIKLYCRDRQGTNGNHISSKRMVWGQWGNPNYCPSNSFLKAVSMRSETIQGGHADDTAVNDFKFTCNTAANNIIVSDNGASWGSWSSYVQCPGNSVICGIKTLVENPVCEGDDTSLNAATFYCCKL